MGPIIRKRSERIIGPRLVDRSLRTLLGNRGSDTERSPLGGLKLMVTWSVSCKPSRRVREFLNLKEKLFGMECKERLANIAPRPTQQQRKALTCSCSVESYGGSYRKGSYLQEKFHTTQSDKDPIRDVAKKKQMKEYADKRRNARESFIVVGDQVLLKQSKAAVLTLAFDPRPFSVIGVKGSMFTVKRGREIKSRNSSHCKLLKHAWEDEYVAVDLDQEGLDASRAEETETREDLRLQPYNLGVSSEMTIGGPRNEPDGPPISLGGKETARHQQQPDNTAVCGPRRSARKRTSTQLEHYLQGL